MWTHLCGASFPLCLTARALIDTEKTRRDPQKTIEDPKRPEKTQKDQRRPKKIQKEFYCLFICHKQIDNNTPFKQIKEMSVSVSVSSFLKLSPQEIDIIFGLTEVVTTITMRMIKSVNQSGYKTPIKPL